MSSNRRMPKLIFAGLDKAGKTTIYKYTIAELKLDESVDSKATRGIDRHVNSFLDMDISVWDLGGQISYRETYLSKPEVFNATSAIIFVVDIQDTARFDEAYNYFTDILKIVINIEPKPKIYVLFHKFDPQESAKFRKHFFQATKIFRQADKIAGVKFTGFATSIYSDTINKAVKRILWENLDDYDPGAAPKREPVTKSPVIKSSATSANIPGITPKEKAPKIIAKEKEGDIEKSLGGSLEKELSGILDDIENIASTSKKPEVFKGEVKPSSSEPAAKDFGQTAETLTEQKSTPVAPRPSGTGSTPRSSPRPSAPRSAPSSSPRPSAPRAMAKSEPVSETQLKEPEVVPEEKKATLKAQKDEIEEENESVIYEDVPDLNDLSTHIVDKLSNIVLKRMNETREIIAIAILGLEGQTPLAVAQNEIEREKLEIVKGVVSQLNPKQFFKDLGDIEYRGLGHLTISDFDIYFARLTDEHAIAILANDVSAPMLENAQRIVTSLRQALGMVSGGTVEEEEEQDSSDEVSLVNDLRSRLSKIGSLYNIDD